MGINKVVVNDEVKLDLTADTVSPSTLALGITAHDKSGELITGTMESGGINEEDLKFSGGLNYFGSGGRLDNLIEHNFDKIKIGWVENDGTKHGVLSFDHGFSESSLSRFPPIIIYGVQYGSLESAFSGCKNLTELPIFNTTPYTGTIGKIRFLFSDCYSITQIPSGYLSNQAIALNEQYDSDTFSGVFWDCFKLEEMNDGSFLQYGKDYSNMFDTCCSLRKLEGLVLNSNRKMDYDEFIGTFDNCAMLSSLVFNSPGDYRMKDQTIDLTTCGYSTDKDGKYTGRPSSYTFQLPYAKKVFNETTYNQLKDTADWWTADVAYSKYDRQSAIATMNSLPDARKYIDSQTSPFPDKNVIKFKKGAGSAKGDLYNMSNLTDEEKGVATAKGWTVELVD